MSRRRKGSSWKSSPRQLPVAAWQVSPRRRGLARHMLAASRGPRVGDSGAAGTGTSGSGCAHPCGNTEEKQGHGRHEIQDVDGLWGRGRAPSGHGTQVGSAGRAGRRVPEGSLHFKFAFPVFSASWSQVWFDVCGSQGRASCGFRALHGSFPRTLLRKQLLPPPFAA